ncbi:hypothetical protein [Flaviflexus massiliensis]|uniref:hypothetical protein n=1 Tax=Flaviflexus massiliensis TaxID=1522309 RepID=UPI0006D52F49|nr:hypothetical protein [Flaviflexus massiliensis]
MMHRLHHVRGMFPFAGHHWFDSDADRSLSEMIGYIQSLASAWLILFLAVAVKKGWTHIVLGQTMILIVLDDYLRIHEELRGTFIDLLSLEPMWGLRAEDLGELLAWLFLGIPILISAVLAWKYSGRRARNQTKYFIAGLGFLLFFAVVIDMIAILLGGIGIEAGALGWQGRAYYVLTISESGGELAGQSIIFVTTLFFALQYLNRAATRSESDERLDAESQVMNLNGRDN